MSFWDSSWESIDPNRIAEYIDTFDMGEDDLIVTLHRYGVQNVCDADCGCGIYTAKLAANGFSVSGFDVSDKVKKDVLAVYGLIAEAESNAMDK